jgi:hypothetical protein
MTYEPFIGGANEVLRNPSGSRSCRTRSMRGAMPTRAAKMARAGANGTFGSGGHADVRAYTGHVHARPNVLRKQSVAPAGVDMAP